MKQYAKKLMDTAILAGTIMLESNAETYRVEETMNYILQTSKFETCEAFAMLTGIIATLDDPQIDSITEIKRITHRGMHLGHIHQVNTISRKLVLGEIDVDTAYYMLHHLKDTEYRSWLKIIALPLMAGGYCALYGGGLLEAIVATVIGFVLIFTSFLDKKFHLGTFTTDILSTFLMGLLTVMTQRFLFPNLQIDSTIVATMMPLVPGTAITNAIRDTLRGDYTSGMGRALEATVVSVAVAAGVALSLFVTGGLF